MSADVAGWEIEITRPGAKRYGIPRGFTDYREMLKERDIELITIAAPNKLHAQMTADCAQAGKHVLCEKPLAMTVEEGEQMIHAALGCEFFCQGVLNTASLKLMFLLFQNRPHPRG